LSVSGDEIFRMFELTRTTTERLKALALRSGHVTMLVAGGTRQVLFNDYIVNPADELFFQNCFDPKVISSEFVLTCRQIRDPSKPASSFSSNPTSVAQQANIGEPPTELTRVITVNQAPVTTAILPKLHLKLLRAERPNYVREAMKLLAEFQKLPPAAGVRM